MTRKKVKLTWIVNDRARKASLKKRRVGLLKKVSELGTLCGVSAFVIVYSPGDNEPTIWPSRPVVEELLARFQNLPEMERSRKLMNQESYLKERVSKDHEQHKKLNRKNLEVEGDHLMSQIYKGKSLDGFQISELYGLAWFIVEKMKDIKKRVDYFQQGPLPLGSLPPQDFMPRDDMGRIERSGDDGNTTKDSFVHQWLTNTVNNCKNVAGSSNVRSNIGLPHGNTYVGSSSVSNDMRVPPHGTFKGHIGGIGIRFPPQGNTGGNISGNIVGLGMGMQPQGNIGGGNGANDIGPGQQPYVTGEFSTGGSETGLPLRIFGGSSGGSDIGLPFDITKTNWPDNSSP